MSISQKIMEALGISSATKQTTKSQKTPPSILKQKGFYWTTEELLTLPSEQSPLKTFAVYKSIDRKYGLANVLKTADYPPHKFSDFVRRLKRITPAIAQEELYEIIYTLLCHYAHDPSIPAHYPGAEYMKKAQGFQADAIYHGWPVRHGAGMSSIWNLF